MKDKLFAEGGPVPNGPVYNLTPHFDKPKPAIKQAISANEKSVGNRTY